MKRRFPFVASLACILATGATAQQANPPEQRSRTSNPSSATTEQTATESSAQQSTIQTPSREPQERQRREPTTPPAAPAETAGGASGQPATPNYHWDMTEVAPVQTHHQITINGRTLHYTATAGRLPIKDPTGKIDAEMFFVAYTLDGADRAKRRVDILL